MALLVPNEGEILMLQYLVGLAAVDNPYIIHLYSANATPDEADTLGGDLTEQSGSGYAAITLTDAFWTVASPGGTTTASHSEVSFSFSGAATLYGYYITDNSNTTILWAEEFTGSPFILPGGGGSIVCSPVISLD